MMGLLSRRASGHVAQSRTALSLRSADELAVQLRHGLRYFSQIARRQGEPERELLTSRAAGLAVSSLAQLLGCLLVVLPLVLLQLCEDMRGQRIRALVSTMPHRLPLLVHLPQPLRQLC
jgi:hypothetical protein